MAYPGLLRGGTVCSKYFRYEIYKNHNLPVLCFADLWVFYDKVPAAKNESCRAAREIEKRNEYLMSGLDEYLRDLDELRTVSLSATPLSNRKLIDKELEKIQCRHLRDAQDLRHKIEKYENDLAEEKAFYELMKGLGLF